MTQNPRTPIGPPVQIVRNNGYQIFQRTWNGQTRHSAKVGRIFHSLQTGQPTIATDFDIWSYDDFSKTCKAAKRHLDKLAINTQQQQAAQVQVQVATPVAPQPQPPYTQSPMPQNNQPAATPSAGKPPAQWNTPQPASAPASIPAPYPSKDYS